MPKFEDWLLSSITSKKYVLITYSVPFKDIKTDTDSLIERGSLMDEIIDDNENIGKLGYICSTSYVVKNAIKTCGLIPAMRNNQEIFVLTPSEYSEFGKEFQLQITTFNYARKFYFRTKDHGICFWIVKRYAYDRNQNKVLDHLYYIYKFNNPNYKRKE